MAQTIELTVHNRLGIHARPAAQFVRCALKFRDTKITIVHEGETYLSTSILEVLSAGLEHGETFAVEADGPEAAAALAAIAELVTQLRDEDERPAHGLPR
jgi:phosphotransferase system HPr (HPr) family protein